MPQRTLLRRLARAAVATTAVALATSTLAPPASAADERDRDRSAATGWLVSELTDDHLYNTEFESVDWGLTVDALFALAADGTRPRVTARLGREIRDHVDDYTTYKGDVSAGAAGKILVAAEVLDADMASFGGHDLRRDLLQLVDDGGADRGRITDSAKTDYSNVITQSYGVIGLSRSGNTPRSTVQFLLKQRCADGSFRLDMTPDSTCEQDGSAADVDATAFAVQALVAADRRGGVSVRDRVITDTGRWLAAAQRRNGGFGGGAATQAPNANSAGVAAQALSITGHDEAVRRAGRFVSGLQITAAKADGGPARSDLGAIALDRDALRTALRQGITTKTSDPFRRATTQAVFALEPARRAQEPRSSSTSPPWVATSSSGACPARRKTAWRRSRRRSSIQTERRDTATPSSAASPVAPGARRPSPCREPPTATASSASRLLRRTPTGGTGRRATAAVGPSAIPARATASPSRAVSKDGRSSSTAPARRRCRHRSPLSGVRPVLPAGRTPATPATPAAKPWSPPSSPTNRPSTTALRWPPRSASACSRSWGPAPG